MGPLSNIREPFIKMGESVNSLLSYITPFRLLETTKVACVAFAAIATTNMPSAAAQERNCSAVCSNRTYSIGIPRNQAADTFINFNDCVTSCENPHIRARSRRTRPTTTQPTTMTQEGNSSLELSNSGTLLLRSNETFTRTRRNRTTVG